SLFQLSRIVGPNRANGGLVASTGWARVTGVVGKIPTAIRRSGGTAAGHLEMGIGISLPEPVPSVLQPLGAVFLRLMGKPGDFVITPDVESFGRTARLSLVP